MHTLGPGSVIVETQQQSDTTYRLYDYGRPRELHLKEGLAAVKLKVASGKVVRPAPAQIRGSNNRQALLVAAPYFVVDMFEMKDAQELSTRDESGKSSVADPRGRGRMRSGRSSRSGTRHSGQGRCGGGSGVGGEVTVRPQWALEFLRARVPGQNCPNPKHECSD